MSSTSSADIVALAPALIVDDDPSVRRRMRDLLVRLGIDASALREAGDIADAERVCDSIVPRLALVDIGLPDGNGLDLVAWMRVAHPEVTSVVMSSFGTEDLIVAAVRCGALGYLLKERDDDELFASLRSIARGGAPIDPFVARHILRLIGSPHRVAVGVTAEAAETLTSRELEILAWVAQGLISREIAQRLDRSPQTIECHIKNIFRKMSVSTRTEAVNQARRRGLLR